MDNALFNKINDNSDKNEEASLVNGFFVNEFGAVYSKEFLDEIDKPLLSPLVRMELGYSSSKNFNNAVSLLKSMPNVSFQQGQLGLLGPEEDKGRLIVEIKTIKEYVENQFRIIRFIEIASRWRDTTIILNGEKFNMLGDFCVFAINLKRKAKEYASMIRENMDLSNRHEYIAKDGEIVYEKGLPLPYVYYPGKKRYFAFAHSIYDKPIFCECQRCLIEFENDWNMFPLGVNEKYNTSADSKPIKFLEFKEKICFKCKSVVPTLLYESSMYASSFESKYGWYVRNKSREIQLYGDNKLSLDGNVKEYADKCKAIIEKIKEIDENDRVYHIGVKKADLSAENIRYRELAKEYKNTIENAAREDLGFKKIGDAWVSETVLFHIIESIFPNSEIKRHYRPDWLEHLELDIYLPFEKIAFEYQGIQHFKPVQHWGGHQKLKVQQEHDLRKARICAERGINLIHINYYDDLTADNISQIISNSEAPHF